MANRWRYYSIRICLGAIFLLLVGRVFWLQVLEGDTFAQLAEKNRLRMVKVPAPRGNIYDRNGELLVTNRGSLSVLYMLPPNSKPDLELLNQLSQILGLSTDQLLQRIKEKRLPFEPAVLLSDAPLEIVSHLEEELAGNEDILVRPEVTREYLYGKTACHLLGYCGEVDQKMLSQTQYQDLTMGDIVGRAGVELTFDQYLRGVDGYEFVAVNAKEERLGLFSSPEPIPPQPGNDLYLTIDLRLQKFVEEILSQIPHPASIIVADARNAQILALASSPQFDPDIFQRGVSQEEWSKLANDPTHPLLNRGINCSFPPGSAFKIVTATAGLEEGVVTPQETMPVPCYGYFAFGDRVFHCWNPSGHGALNISQGLTNSCNVFFFQLGLRLGLDNLAKYAQKYMLGEPTGIELPGEAKGTIPDRTTMEEKYGEKIPAGEVLNDAIGQGHVLVSPIQLLMVLTAIANQGQVLRPTLLSQVCTPEGEIISSTERVVRSDLRLSPVTVDTILEGLAGVVNRFGENREHLVGKTGSAENPHGDTHAWFVGFAPQENPRISLVIFVENGGFGESYIKYAKQIVAFCREQGIPDSDWWNLNLATLEETIPQE
jgi:penicillin-binding protein 2